MGEPELAWLDDWAKVTRRERLRRFGAQRRITAANV